MKQFLRLFLAYTMIFAGVPSLAQTSGKQAEFNSVMGVEFVTNFVKNPSAAKNINDLTALGVTVTRDTSAGNKIDGIASFQLTATSNNGTFAPALNTIDDNVKSGNCIAKFRVKGDASLWFAEVLDGSTVVSSQQLQNTQSTWQNFSINYPCAFTTSRGVQLRASTLSAAVINAGELSWGKATNVGQGVPTNVFSAKVASSNAVSDENEDFINGNCPITDSSLFTCTFITGKFSVAPNCTVSLAGTGTDTSTLTARIEGAVTTTSVSVRTGYSNTTSSFVKNPWSFVLKCDRASTDFMQPTITPNQWNFDWTTCPSISGSWIANTTYICKYRRQGSVADFDISWNLTGTPTSAALSLNIPVTIDTTKLAAANASYTILSGSVGLQNATTGYKGYALYSTTTSIVMAYQNATTGAGALITQAAPFTWGSGSYGNVRFSVPVLGWSENQNAPQLTGSVTSNSTGTMRLESVRITNNGTTCAIASQTSNWLGTPVRNATGRCQAPIVAGTFGSEPYCTCVAQPNTASLSACGLDGSVILGTTNIAFATSVGAAGSDLTAVMTCYGPRP